MGIILLPSQIILSNIHSEFSLRKALITAHPILLVPKSNPKICLCSIFVCFFFKDINFSVKDCHFHFFFLYLRQ